MTSIERDEKVIEQLTNEALVMVECVNDKLHNNLSYEISTLYEDEIREMKDMISYHAIGEVRLKKFKLIRAIQTLKAIDQIFDLSKKINF